MPNGSVVSIPALDDLPAAMTVQQAASLLGVSPDLIWRLIREDRCPFPHKRMGRMIRIPTGSFYEWINGPRP